MTPEELEFADNEYIKALIAAFPPSSNEHKIAKILLEKRGILTPSKTTSSTTPLPSVNYPHVPSQTSPMYPKKHLVSSTDKTSTDKTSTDKTSTDKTSTDKTSNIKRIINTILVHSKTMKPINWEELSYSDILKKYEYKPEIIPVFERFNLSDLPKKDMVYHIVIINSDINEYLRLIGKENVFKMTIFTLITFYAIILIDTSNIQRITLKNIDELRTWFFDKLLLYSCVNNDIIDWHNPIGEVNVKSCRIIFKNM